MNKASGGDRNPIELFNILKDDQYSCLENPMTEKPGGLQSMGFEELGKTQ